MAEPSVTDVAFCRWLGWGTFLPSSRLVPHLVPELSHRHSAHSACGEGGGGPPCLPNARAAFARSHSRCDGVCYARFLPLAFFERRAGGREWRPPVSQRR